MDSGFYIGQLGELIVSFGGRIGVGSQVFNEDGNLVKELVVMELEKPHEIGADLTNEETPENKDAFPILFEFRDDKSIDIREYEGCVILIYKTWNRFKQMWDYAGCKFTEILYWNSILWELNNKERKELFRLNGFDWDKVKGY